MVVRVFKYIIKAIIISIILLISAILTVRVVNTFKLNRVQKLLSDLYYEDRLYFEDFIDEKSIGDLEIKQSSFKRTKESLLTLKSIDKDIVDASKVDGASYLKGAAFIKLPLAVPYIVVGIVSSFALSFKIEIMAEVITGSTKNGLGSSINYAYSQAEMPNVFAYSLLVIIFMLLVSLIEQIVKQK